MADLICPYSAALAQGNIFSCQHADEVIRRGGSEYVCLLASSHAVCCNVYDKVKQVSLQNQGLEDDLLSLPHSMYVKIQFGCILGLQSAAGREATNIEDIGALITDAVRDFKKIDSLPFAVINDAIMQYKPQRRRR